MFTSIAKVTKASELFRAIESDCHERIVRADMTIVLPLNPGTRREAQAIIDRVEGPFASSMQAEERVVAAIRDWQDSARAAYYA